MIRTDHPDRLSPNIRWEVLICLLLAVLTASVYFRVIDYPFIHYDDHLYVSDNLHVQAGLTLKSVIWAFTRSIEASNYYIPLTWLSLIVDQVRQSSDYKKLVERLSDPVNSLHEPLRTQKGSRP